MISEEDSKEPHLEVAGAESKSCSEPEVFEHKELLYWLAFDQIHGTGISSENLLHFYERFGSIGLLFTASESELLELGFNSSLGLGFLDPARVAKLVEKRKGVEGEQVYQSVLAAAVRPLPLVHPEYPGSLRQIHFPPLVLYVKGQLDLGHIATAFAVVGTRSPTAYGQKMAKKFSYELAQAGLTIVSGMALGVDSLAHWGAIEAGGRTLAILASGPDYVYPPTNKHLYEKLCTSENTCVLSEYIPGILPEKWRFPARNRIITGLSQGLLLVEAGEKSGSLISARLAFEQNRHVFAIPGRIDTPMSYGPNNLIHQDSARLVLSTEQILAEMEIATAKIAHFAPMAVQLYGREKEIFDQLAEEPTHFEQICQQTGMNPAEASSALTMLELAGVVQRLPGDWYQKS